MGRQVSSKMCSCFLCIMRRQFEDLFICEKKHPKSAKKARAKIGTLNLQNEAVPMSKKTTRKNWHLKCGKKTHAKIGTLNLQYEAVCLSAKKVRAKRGSVYLQKKYVQNEAVSICKKSTCKTRQCLSAKKVRAKRGSVYLQKKYVQKFAC